MSFICPNGLVAAVPLFDDDDDDEELLRTNRVVVELGIVVV